jgi:hypothetical protein
MRSRVAKDVMADQWLTPKYGKGQKVRISLHESSGKVQNELARKSLRYYSQTAEVISGALWEAGGAVVVVYRVRAEDGTILQLTEDCLMPLKDIS